MSAPIADSGDGRSPVRKPSILSEATFLQHTLIELTGLEHEAEIHYHGVLVRMLAAARVETEMLLREEMQAQAWPHSAGQPLLRIR